MLSRRHLSQSNKEGNHIARLLTFDHGLGRKLNLTYFNYYYYYLTSQENNT